MMIMSRQIQRVKQLELWSTPKTVLVALLTAALGTLFPIAQHFVFGSLWRLKGLMSIVSTVLLFVLLATVLILCHKRLRHWYHAALFGFAYGYAVPMMTIAVHIISMGYVPMGVIARGLLFSCVPGAVSAGLALAVWTASRLSRGRLIIAFTPACPKCGYSLIGNTNRTCPECGVPFTLEELQIPEEALQPRSVLADADE